MKIENRKPYRDELPIIQQIENKAFSYEKPLDKLMHSVSSFSVPLKRINPLNSWFILYDGWSIIGYAMLKTCLPLSCICLADLCVSKQFQGQGYGKAFLHSIEKRLKQKGYKRIYFISLPESEGFYLKMGYCKRKGYFFKELK